MPIRAATALETHPDKIVVVYEDLGTTGIKSTFRCPNCGMFYPVEFRPDGTISYRQTTPCITCGSKLTLSEPIPKETQWSTAIDMLHNPPATYKVVDDVEFDPVAKEHLGQPVKILKIIGFEASYIIFEVQFRDWKTAHVLSSDLEICKAKEGPAA